MSTKEARRRRRSLRRVLGTPPSDDALAASSWMFSALARLALEIDSDRDLEPKDRRAELIRIAHAMARLRPTAQIADVRRTLIERLEHRNDWRPDGPALEPAPSIAGSTVVARRGRPPARGKRS